MTEPSTTYDSRPETYDHIAHVRQYLLTIAVDLITRSHSHDASKLFDPERATFDEYTPKLADVEYGSAEYEAHLAGMREGLVHHYSHNDHHPEHFEGGIADMTIMQLTEMLCDWMAATLRHPHGDIERSISEVNKARFGYGDEIEQLLLNTARSLRRFFPPVPVPTEAEQADAARAGEGTSDPVGEVANAIH